MPLRVIGVAAAFGASLAVAEPSGHITPLSVLAPYTVTSASGDFAFQGVVAADFNRDGRDDLAVLSAPPVGGTATLTVYLGQLDGKVRSAWAIAFAIGSRSDLKMGDFNSDGRPDLVLVQTVIGVDGRPTTSAAIMAGVGDGTFQPAGTPVSGPESQVLAADLDGDGRGDLIIGPLFFRAKSDGTMSEPISLGFTPMLVADFNRDGIPDVITNSVPPFFHVSQPDTTTTLVFLGRGGGVFEAGGRSLPTTIYRSIVAADFDGDGYMDIAAATSPNSNAFAFFGAVLIFAGKGDGSFRAPIQVVGSTGDLLASDFNGDGTLDLFSGFSFVLGKGSGQFYPPLWLYTPSYSCDVSASGCEAAIGHSVLLDVNGDGRTDVAYVFATGTNNREPSQLLLFVNGGPGDGILASAVPPTQDLGVAARNSIASIYGVDLSPESANASVSPLSTTLGGIRLHIGDQLAQLLSVSPSQINYIVPDWPSGSGTAFYHPTVSIERVDRPYIAKGISAPSVTEFPVLFSVDPSGLAAASAIRISPDGIQTVVPMLNCAQSKCVPVSIDTGGDPVYLSLFATGINNPTAASSGDFTCSGGTVTYVGPQGLYPGLQQINLRLESTALRE